MTSRRWLRAFRVWRNSPTSDVDAELRFHFEQRIADLIARGHSREAAAIQAETEFGDRTATRAELVAINERIATQHRRADWWDTVGQDVRYTLRGLRRAPAFSAMVVATLALGLGANTALVSVLERLLWRSPAGVPAAREVRRVHNYYFDQRTHAPAIRSVFNYTEMRGMVQAKPSGLGLAGFRDSRARLGSGSQGRDIATVELIGDYFGVLALQPAAGRFFTADEARAETLTPLAVISHRLWARDFGGSSSVVGQPLDLGSRHYTIIGVAPQSFQGLGLDAADVWIPMNSTRSSYERNAHWYDDTGTMFIHLVSRVRSGQDSLAFTAATTAAMRETRADSMVSMKLASVIEPVWPGGHSDELTMATRLAGVAAILLLIACANVANLLLARGVRRRREIAVRLALGVSKARLVSMLMMESVSLAFVGGVLGFAVGAIASSALRHALLPRVMWGDRVLEFKVALFSMALAMITGVLTGLVPALRASRPELTGALKAGARGGRQRSRMRNGLIVAQAALSVVLVAAAGMFVVSLRRVQSINTGYAVHDVLIAELTSLQGMMAPTDLDATVPSALERIRGLPNVEAVGLAENAPFVGFSYLDVFMQNRVPVKDLAVRGPFVSYIAGDFFAAAGMRVIHGRGGKDIDRRGSPNVLFVNEIMAQALWPGENAVGKCLIIDEPNTPCREVIGVVSNSNSRGYIEEPSAQFYVPAHQAGREQPATFVIRVTPGRIAAVLPAIQRAMIEGFPGWGPPRLRTLATILAPQLQPRRLAASAYGAAALLALLIAAVGIYSSVAYAVGQRMHEMGVRAALGARSGHIVRLILGEGVRVVLIGVVLGVGLALALGRAIASLLYNTSTRDPVLLASVSLALLVVALIACFVPAWRATRANPVEVLRAD